MKQFALFVLAVCMAALGTPALGQHGTHQVEITGDAWVRATPPKRTVTAAYLAIRNTGDEVRRVVGASSTVAGRAELHTHIHDRESGMMQMRHVDFIELPPGETVRLAPGGLHIMMMDVTRDLQPGMTVPLSLEFDDGHRLEVEVPVHREAPHASGHGSHGHDHHRH
ncbi:copper chaperone PCu(A)C [Thioalkalivibrio thiocyanodenitrificans]|uniref:copper chaperone PCu(A)C n=1 Tax=Thioalkalivibrio thiocyanodenitrificans TaxID=243063 RepID=UPI000475DCBA|nr:copper chaperone PCu(A)C [Thioalkalivibrio thiocyanodenitrificans]